MKVHFAEAGRILYEEPRYLPRQPRQILRREVIL